MMLETRAHTRIRDHECFDLRHVVVMQDRTYKHPRLEEFERHMGQSNVLFVDGHVDPLEATEIGRLAGTAELSSNGYW